MRPLSTTPVYVPSPTRALVSLMVPFRSSLPQAQALLEPSLAPLTQSSVSPFTAIRGHCGRVSTQAACEQQSNHRGS
jgi:hypothetical protein